MTQPNSPSARGAVQKPEGEQDIAQIEAQIDQTRNAISSDLRTLGERLSPEHLKEEAREVMLEAKDVAVETMHEAKNVATSTFREVKESAVDTVSAKVGEIRDNVRENVRQAERDAFGFLRENAVPLALIGVGLTWFMSNRRSRDRQWDGAYRLRGEGRWRYPEEPGHHPLDEARHGFSKVTEGTRELTSQAKERAQHWVEDAESRVGDVAGRVRGFAEREAGHVREAAHDAEHKLGEVTDRARHVARQELREAREFSREATENHPLAVGAAAVAAGICVGLMLPSTRREREMLGPQRDRWAGEAKGAVQDWTHAAKETARDVKSTLSGSAS